jgi:SAM-dependent methyltransferase
MLVVLDDNTATMNDTTAANAAQITHWNDAPGQNWAALSELLDRQCDGISRRTIEALAPRAGERLVDVGCGCGRTSLLLSAAVGPQGAVLGLDVSQPMLCVARDRAAAEGVTNVRFLEADAQTHAFDEGTFDAVFSRFGVMFFAAPTEAFVNLRRALKPGGRLAFLCWRSPADNPVLTTPMAAAGHRFPPQDPPVAGAPGPFAFAAPELVRNIVEGAGFAEVALTPHDVPMGGITLEDSLAIATRVGPLAALLRANPELLPLAREDVRAAVLPHVRDGAVWQRSATWIVTAKNP